MKKMLSILCLVALVCALMVPVSAESMSVTLGGEQTVEPGATFTVPVVMNNNTGVAMIKISISYASELKIAAKPTMTQTGLSTLTGTPGGNIALNPYSVNFDGLENDTKSGEVFTISFIAPTTPGAYDIKVTASDAFDGDLNDLTIAGDTAKITVKGSDPEPVAKTVTYTAVNGTVMASTVALAAPAEAKASGTITTAGTAPEEEVYFYFFPNKGYTTDGMTVNGAEVIGAAASKKYTVTADATYDFVFKKIEDAAAITAKPTGAISGTPAAASLTTFATAAGASEFGILIGAADAWGTDITADYAAASETGKIRKYAALEANGEGQFAIELNDTAKNFLKNGTYRAYIYAANGSIVSFGDAIDIAIAE